MKRWWPREVLRFVDAWACREGTPEDDEDARSRVVEETREAGANAKHGRRSDDSAFCPHLDGVADKSGVVVRGESSRATRRDEIWPVDETDWIELEVLENVDEELGRRGVNSRAS